MCMMNKMSTFYRKTVQCPWLFFWLPTPRWLSKGQITHLIGWKGHKATFQGMEIFHTLVWLVSIRMHIVVKT